MGVVYKARQKSLDRVVALKMVLAGHLAGPDQVERFRREARAAARLDHPHIVPIYAVGQHDGQHYFSMKLIEGRSLGCDVAHYRRNHRAAAFLVSQVARAVHYAHQKGILHRDLKPGNILLDGRKQPHVTDFGLAKRLDASGSLSPEGAVIGTAGYMAPEQAAGRRLTPAADVYSLGAVLYELLTGRPPFQGATAVETLWQVLDREPPPRQLNPAVPGDLETICLRCLDKRPSRRYASAEELADDLERWAEGKPIRARRVSRAERAWLWCRRKPALAGLASAAVLAIALGSGIAALNWDKAKDAEAGKIAALRREEDAKDVNNRLNDELAGRDELVRKAVGDKQEQDRVRETEKEREREREEDRAERDRAARYEADMRKAGQLAESEDYEALSRLLKVWEPAPKAHDYRRWEWRYLRAVAARSSLVPPYQADPKSDDEWYFTLPGRGHSIVRLDWSPEGRRLAVYDEEGWLRVLDVASARESFARQFERGAPGRAAPLGLMVPWRPDAWSPDGERLALADSDGTVKILDAATGKQVAELPKPLGRPPRQNLRRRHSNGPTGYREIAWSPDGRRIVAAGGDGKIPVYDTATGKEVQSLTGHEGPVLAVAWSGNGRQLASGGADGQVKVWDVQADREAYALTVDAAVVALAWSPDGRQILASGAPIDPESGALRFDQAKGSTLWDVAKREVVWRTPAVACRSTDFSWSGDGERVGVRLCGPVDPSYSDGLLLDARSGHVLYRGGRHPTGRVFADAQLRQAVQLTSNGLHRRGFVLDLPGGQVSRVLFPWLSTSASNIPKYEGIAQVAWAPGGSMLALASTQGNVQIRHLPRDGRRSRTLVVQSASGVGWEPDGLRFAINGLTGSLPLGVEDQRKANSPGRPNIVLPSQGILALSPDGTHLAATLDDKSIQLWDATTGKRTTRLAGHPRFVDPPWDGVHSLISKLWWSPHGKYFASFRAWDGTLKVWDVAGGKEQFGLDFGGMTDVVLSFSEDEKRLALSVNGSLAHDSETSVLDAATGRRLSRLTPEYYCAVAWSPDGGLLACQSFSRHLLDIWDTKKGDKVDTVDEGPNGAASTPSVAWDPAGRRVAWVTSHNPSAIYDVKARRTVAFEAGGASIWTQLVWKPDGEQLAVTNTANLLVFNAASGAKLFEERGQSIAWAPGGLIAARFEVRDRVVETEGPVKGSVERTTVRETVLQVHNRGTDKTVDLEPLAEKPPTPAPPAPPAHPMIPGAPALQYWSPDNKHVAGLRSPGPGDFKTPMALILYDATGKLEHELVGEPEQINVGLRPLAAWSPDSKYIAGGGNVHVWNAATGEEVFRLSGHDGVVESIDWSPDGRRIVTRSQVKKPFRNSWELKVWDAGDGHEILTIRSLVAELTFNSALAACSFVLTNEVGNDSTVVLWDLSPVRGKGDE
jgi:WD40 repeat protein